MKNVYTWDTITSYRESELIEGVNKACLMDWEVFKIERVDEFYIAWMRKHREIKAADLIKELKSENTKFKQWPNQKNTT